MIKYNGKIILDNNDKAEILSKVENWNNKEKENMKKHCGILN